jgi:hypothetical protein
MSILYQSINYYKYDIFPFDFGNPSMKSMLMKVQAMVGMGRGARRPG